VQLNWIGSKVKGPRAMERFSGNEVLGRKSYPTGMRLEEI